LLRGNELLIEYLILKLTLEAIVGECNRMLVEQESHAYKSWISSRLIQLKTEFEKGAIDYDTYVRKELEILSELDRLPAQSGDVKT
jgi:hypothetical protein